MTILIFSVVVLAYFAIHSLLAADSVKLFLTQKIIPARYYRLVYNLLAIVLLAPPGWLYFSMKKEVLLENPWFALPGVMLVFSGITWIYRSMKGYDLGEFSGLLQLKTGRQPAHTALQVGGLNRMVRHPMYFGILLTVWGVFLVSPTDAVLVFSVLSTVYLYAGSRLEERKLTQQFGDTYRSYQENVPMLLPFKFRGGKN